MAFDQNVIKKMFIPNICIIRFRVSRTFIFLTHFDTNFDDGQHYEDAKYGYVYIMERLHNFFKSFRSSDLYTTLSYVLMGNFCPYFLYNRSYPLKYY